jgi:predicted outer membrane repeat protein
MKPKINLASLQHVHEKSGYYSYRALLCAVIVICACPASRAALQVPGDFPSIQAAINGAPDNSVIEVAPGTYYEALNVVSLRKRLYIRATSKASPTIIDGENVRPLLYIFNFMNGDPAYIGDPDKNLVFDGFTFYRGRGEANTSPVTIADARPAFLNCVFSANSSAYKGGAVLVYDLYNSSTHVSFIDTQFINNQSDFSGGAVLANGGHPYVTFKSCLFDSNTIRTPRGKNYTGGGAVAYTIASGRISDCVFRNNSAGYVAGAVVTFTPFSETLDVIEIENSHFDGNFAEEIPGIAPAPGPTAGGALHVEDNITLYVSGCIFENNRADTGASLGGYRAEAYFAECYFDGEVSTGTGAGGVLAMDSHDSGSEDRREGVLAISNSILRNCTSPVGGAIFVQGDTTHQHTAPLLLDGVIIEQCLAEEFGGGIFLNLATCTGNAVHLLRNRAKTSGGAVTMVNNSSLTLQDSFVVGNDADWDTLHPDIYNPDGGTVSTPGTYFGWNGGGGGSKVLSLTAQPPVMRGDTAYIAYVAGPFGASVTLWPHAGELDDHGGYTAGVAVVPGLTSNTTFTLDTGDRSTNITVTYEPNMLYQRGHDLDASAVPGRIESEHYDTGGHGVSYWDSSDGNAGGTGSAYGDVDVISDPSASGGLLVGYMGSGEWLEYTLNIQKAGQYRLNIGVSSPMAGSRLLVLTNGHPLVEIDVPNTGGWANWEATHKNALDLPFGLLTLRVLVVEEGFNLDYIEFVPEQPVLSVAPSSIYVTCKEGRTAGAALLGIRNAGGQVLTYSAAIDQPWCSLSVTDGTCTTETDALAVTFSSAAMTTDVYHATITVTSPDAGGMTNIVSVDLRVTATNQFVRNDFDGDGRTDIGIYYPPEGRWQIFRSTLGYYEDTFGYDGTVPVTGDYDGDKLADMGVYNLGSLLPPAGRWYMYRSQDGFEAFDYGYEGVSPVSGDFDGDGLYDVGVYYPTLGKWHIFGSRVGQYEVSFGFAGTTPVPADYDGDGTTDLAVYHAPSGKWYIYGSYVGFYEETYGYAGTLPAPGDYDGDGRTDLCVYDPPIGKWYVFGSTIGQYEETFGYAGTIPVPGDYDGDGRSDLCVYYAPQGKWYIFRSSEGFLEDTFGYDGTIPVGAILAP